MFLYIYKLVGGYISEHLFRFLQSVQKRQNTRRNATLLCRFAVTDPFFNFARKLRRKKAILKLVFKTIVKPLKLSV